MFGRKSHLTVCKKRIREMDKALSALERIAAKCPANAKANKLVSEMKKRRAQLWATADQMTSHINRAEARMNKLSSAGAVSWSAFRRALTKSQKAFARANHKAGKAIRSAVR